MRQLGVFLTIPFVLAVPPVLGWLLGGWIDQFFGTEPIFMYVLILLGIVAGFREVYRIITRYGSGI